MKIFISWSGERSKLVAELLQEWFGQVIQLTEPWISTSIDKGKRWSRDISSRLEESKIGIICLTKDNLNAPWILFEAGALSKNSDSYVCTFLADINSPSEITGPLSHFQATKFNREDIFKLCLTINKISAEHNNNKGLSEAALKNVFETFYPILESKLNAILKDSISDQKAVKNLRSDRELLEDTLQNLRFITDKLSQQWDSMDVTSFIEYHAKNFTKNRPILYSDIGNEPHLSEFIESIADNPAIRKLFPEIKFLEEYLIEKYSSDLPF